MSVEGVKSWMNFLGWDDGGKFGTVKRDANGHVAARHGDATWERDLETAIAYDRKERAANLAARS